MQSYILICHNFQSPQGYALLNPLLAEFLTILDNSISVSVDDESMLWHCMYVYMLGFGKSGHMYNQILVLGIMPIVMQDTNITVEFVSMKV